MLVLDFDGTTTEQDTLALLVREFGDPEAHRRGEERLGRGLTLHEVIARGYGSIKAPLEEVRAWTLANVQFRAGFPELAELARRQNMQLLVVSSGIEELIRPLLEREALADVGLVANRATPTAEGWRVQFRDEPPCELCGEVCKRAVVTSRAGGREVVYVGDGYSDLCAALAAGRVFARRRLAARLTELRIEYEPFEDLHDVVAGLER